MIKKTDGLYQPVISLGVTGAGQSKVSVPSVKDGYSPSSGISNDSVNIANLRNYSAHTGTATHNITSNKTVKEDLTPAAGNAGSSESTTEQNIFDSPFRTVDEKTAENKKAEMRSSFPTSISTIDGLIPNNDLLSEKPGVIGKTAGFVKDAFLTTGDVMKNAALKTLSYIIGEDPSFTEAKKLTDEVLALDTKMAKLSDSQLKAQTTEFKQRLQAGESLDDILPEAFAAMREADFRVTGMKPYPEQVLGGVCTHQGRVVEMKTGEGKTLMETMPVYLNALSGNGVHVITANEYLAGRDKEEMGKIFDYMGLSVSQINNDISRAEAKEANKADIIYGTASDFGFQYLRDNLVNSTEDKVGRDLSKTFALVDEVDSILIDEARTPLIISQGRNEEKPPYDVFAAVVKHLDKDTHYEVDEKKHSAWLTDSGLEQVEKMLGVGELYTDKNDYLLPYVSNALLAETLYHKDKNYIVEKGEVKIVDEFTGRVMEGRRFSQGIHQAIEAKENVETRDESDVLASVSLQNYFRQYGKLGGMTGTGKTSEVEFNQVFGKGVDVIPTHKPIIRKDMPDVVYTTKAAKMKAIVGKIAQLQESGQPVLIGTRSVEDSEELSKMLVDAGVSHTVLNAKYHKEEAEIIAQAGRKGAVTIATNMAGRGVDVKLGGEPKKLASEFVKKNGGSYDAALAKFEEQCGKEKQQVFELGGLFVLGTEKHTSQRVDNQLRGRSGRNGQPGASQFFVSLEDEVIQRFAGDKVKNLVSSMGGNPDTPITNSLISKIVDTAQESAESADRESRKSMLKYDNVVNMQRNVVYRDRDSIMKADSVREDVRNMITHTFEKLVENVEFSAFGNKDESMQELAKQASHLLGRDISGEMMKAFGEKKLKKRSQRKDFLVKTALETYEEKERQIGPQLRDAEKQILLNLIDGNWVDQQTMLQDLQSGIHLRAFAQQDPELAYNKDAFEMFTEMQDKVSAQMTRAVMSIRLK